MLLESKLHKLLVFLLFPATVLSAIAAVLTKEEFNSAVTSNGYRAPADDVYNYFAEYTGDFSRDEIAMFVAQLILESGGFKHTEQLDCQKPGACVGWYEDGAGLANVSYHGRGYIQLTWPANYRLASLRLGMSDELLRHPDIVAEDKRVAMLVSVWYWNARVRPLLRGRADQFGLTTKGINPGECVNTANVNVIARRRYRIYVRVAEVLKLKSKAKENGCYN